MSFRPFLNGVLAMFVIIACNKSTLTTERAQKTLDSALAQKLADLSYLTDWAGASVKVQGVQVDTQGNGATADFIFISPNSQVVDQGTATFKHYTDGRWVLTGVQTKRNLHLSGTVEVE